MIKGSSGSGIEGKHFFRSLSNVGETFGGSTESSDKKFDNTVDKNETTIITSDVKEKYPLGSLAWFISPFINKIELSKETLIDERIAKIKDTLANLAESIFPNQETDPGSKQIPVNIKGIGNLLGLNGSRFYTNKIDPAGFFDGNGWFANKGGILGVPGAFISTGSLFTDYQTPYKK